jgi:hypothetical protein
MSNVEGTVRERVPLFTGNFSDPNLSLSQITSQHLAPEGLALPGLEALHGLSYPLEGVEYSPNPHAGEFTTIQDKIGTVRELVKFSPRTPDQTVDHLEEYTDLIERALSGELSEDERLARFLNDPGVFFHHVLHRSKNVMRGVEDKNTIQELEHNGRYASVYFLTENDEGAKTITKTSWFYRYAKPFEMGDRPESVSRRQWVAMKSMRLFTNLPALRVYSVDANTQNTQNRAPLKGYSLSQSGALIEISGTAISMVRISQSDRYMSPYFTVPESMVRPVHSGSKLKPFHDIGKILIGDQDESAKRYVDIVSQLRPGNILAGAGLGLMTKAQLAKSIQTGTPEQIGSIDRITSQIEAQLSKPDVFRL